MTYDPMYFRSTLETLNAGTLAELVNFTDMGFPYAALNELSRRALEDCGILPPFYDLFKQAQELGVLVSDLHTLTPYGVAFLQWYRVGRDLPVQMRLFGEDTHDGR
jgi:hypothetical protein